MTIDRRGGVPRLPCGSSEPAGSVRGDPPLRPKSLCSHVESLSANEQVEMCPCSAILSLFDRVGGWKLSISKLRSCTQIAIWLRLIRVVAFLRQRAVPEAAAARPGRGRLSVGRQPTAGAPAGRKPLKSRKARNRLLQCPSGAAATLVTLLVPPATVSRAPATSCAGCKWGVHGHRRRRVRGEWLVTITKSVALRTAEERLSAQALIRRRATGAGCMCAW